MTKKNSNTLTQKIVDNIPHYIKPVDYLIDRLKISRESAYRRLRGQFPFTFNELSLLSIELNFSVDEIIRSSEEGHVFFNIHAKPTLSPEESFLSMMQDCYQYLNPMETVNSKDLFISINRLGLHLLIEFDSLFKFFYYKWLRLINCSSGDCPFSKVIVPAEVLAIRNKIRVAMSGLDSINYILDKNIFLPLVQEIQYHHSRKLISEGEITKLKEDLIKLLEDMEKAMSKGMNESNSIKHIYYLSLIDIEANASCIVNDKNISTLYWLYSLNASIIKNEDIAYLHKMWFESLKKHSVLITQSNEIQRIEFVNKQKECIEKINKNLVYYE
jgi:hypothetical protein